MQTYYIVRPKHGLVLDSNLHWKRATECSGNGPGFALGLEMGDALNVASWASFDGVSAVPYPETTACSHFEKSSGRPFLLRKTDFSHQEFVSAVNQNVYPEFLLRKPLNKAEKKLLFGRFVKGVKSREPAKVSGEPAAVLMKKRDLRGDSEYSKGVENVFYIVNTKKGLFLTKTLSWVGIGALRSDKKLRSQLFSVRGDISIAQSLAQWVMPPGEVASPCTPSTLKRKYHLAFPNPTSDTLINGIRSHKLPSFLSRKPESRREIAAFQLALRDGLFELEERTLLSLGECPRPEPAETEQVGGLLSVEQNSMEKSEVIADSEDLLSAEPGGKERERFGFQGKVSSVCESSDLIRNFVESAMAFGKMLNDLPSLVAQRRLDLDTIQRQLTDLDHVTEFYSMNASDGYRLNKTRKDFLQRRRIIKNELAVLDMASHYLSDGATPAKISRFVNAVMGLDHRIYTTRVMTVEDIKKLICNPKTREIILGSHESAKEAAELIPNYTDSEEPLDMEKVSA